MVIFTSSLSQMCFKLSVFKNVAVLEPLFNNKVTEFLFQKRYSDSSLIFVAVNTIFQLNLVFFADSRTSFCAGLLWQHELNLKLKLFLVTVQRCS